MIRDPSSPAAAPPARDRLGDFTTDTRLLILTPMAVVVGAISAFVAVVLVWLIGTATNIAYYHRLSSSFVSPANNQLGLWAVLVPMCGVLIVGLMARFGSDRIRGHGIPEAMEAILIGRSRMSAKVAILKPLSSAISIGTGGAFGGGGPPHRGQPDVGQGRDPEAALLGHLDRDRRAVRRGGPHHHDRWRVRVTV